MTITTSPRSLLELSDERDTALQLRLAAYREGHALSAQEQWAAGYAAAIGDVKREEPELVRGVQLEAARSAPGGAAWAATVARNGGTEYGGAGKPRVAVDPEAIDRVRREQGGMAR